MVSIIDTDIDTIDRYNRYRNNKNKQLCCFLYKLMHFSVVNSCYFKYSSRKTYLQEISVVLIAFNIWATPKRVLNNRPPVRVLSQVSKLSHNVVPSNRFNHQKKYRKKLTHTSSSFKSLPWIDEITASSNCFLISSSEGCLKIATEK